MCCTFVQRQRSRSSLTSTRGHDDYLLRTEDQEKCHSRQHSWNS